MSVTESLEAPVDERDDAWHARFVWAITTITGVGLWVLPSFSSYWLDETATVWVIRDGLGTAIDRAFEYQQSPFYFVIAWGARALFGTSEFALRVPSLLASVAASWFLYRLAVRLHDRGSARLVVFAFVASPWMAFAAADARAYAIAIAATVGAALSLWRWQERGRGWDGVGFASACAVAIWAHYVFGLGVAVFVVIAAVRNRPGVVTDSWLALVLAVVGIGVTVAPLTAHLVTLMARSETLTIPWPMSVESLFTYLVRPVTIGALLLGTLIARALMPISVARPAASERGARVLARVGARGPSHLFRLGIRVARHVPGAEVLVGRDPRARGVRGPRHRLHPSRRRTADHRRGRGDRGHALDHRFPEVRRGMAGGRGLRTDLGRSPPPPSSSVRGSSSPISRIGCGTLLAADSCWPPRRRTTSAGSSSRCRTSSTRTVRHTSRILVSERLEGADRFLFVARDRDTHEEAWLDGRLDEAGFVSQEIGMFGAVYVVEFTRDDAP